MNEYRLAILKAAVVWAHDGKCHYCGGPGRDADHIVPRARGGADVPENMVAACRSCNARKSDRLLGLSELERACAAASEIAPRVNEVLALRSEARKPGAEKIRVQIIYDEAFIKMVDEWRRLQPRIPSRSAAIVHLAELGARPQHHLQDLGTVSAGGRR